MSEFTMHEYSDEDMERMFEGMKKYVRDTSNKTQDKEWQDAWLKVGIRIAIRCKQRIDNIPIALIPTESATECWNGYREEEE